MYKTSNDRRFLRNKKTFQQAFIDLVIEKEDTHFSIAELTRKADLNRMTFYAHYDIVEDVFLEAGNRFDFKNAFKECIGRLVQFEPAESHPAGKSHPAATSGTTQNAQRIRSDLCAVCIAYAYLDWLAGEYGDATLEEVLALTKDLLKDHLPGVSYR